MTRFPTERPVRLAGAVALAACLLPVSSASAELLTRRIDATINDAEFLLDLNEDGVDDFLIDDNGEGFAAINAISDGAGVMIDPEFPFPPYPVVYSRGDRIDPAPEGFDPQNPDAVYTFFLGVFSGVFMSPFDEVGSTGFIGLTVGDSGGGDVTIGFLEITRGSTIVGLVGYSTTPGPITIPVPEPAAALLAAASLVAVRRRRR